MYLSFHNENLCTNVRFVLLRLNIRGCKNKVILYPFRSNQYLFKNYVIPKSKTKVLILHYSFISVQYCLKNMWFKKATEIKNCRSCSNKSVLIETITDGTCK